MFLRIQKCFSRARRHLGSPVLNDIKAPYTEGTEGLNKTLSLVDFHQPTSQMTFLKLCLYGCVIGVLLGAPFSSKVVGSMQALYNKITLDLNENDLSSEFKSTSKQGNALFDVKTNKATDVCPNPRFVEKHVCKECKDLNDALEFSKKRAATFPTGKNTVIMGDAQFVLTKEGDRCTNINGCKVVTCTINTGHCYTEGESCTTFHAVGNGHMFYRETIC